ncbi:MAG: lytic transglycosylase domain-containing protein [Oscillospiraceae bacterium]|jgi:soluble lytic murein transglycosylase-like protein|nr:lytic transglycosylase domain-containing protein [Oscillospiraceae bacterium]
MPIDKVGGGTPPEPNTTVKSAAEGNTSGADFSETLKKTGEAALDPYFQAASERYGVPVSLLKAVARSESNFRSDAVSRAGAVGVMQLMPATAAGLGVTDPLDPEQNIMGGAKYLRQQLDAFDGDTRLALAAYNAGPGNVRKYGGVPPFKETQNYVQKVMSLAGGSGKIPAAGSAGSRPNGDFEFNVYDSADADAKILAESLLWEILNREQDKSDER